MQLLHASKCCCCADLRIGGLIIGWLQVLSLIFLICNPKLHVTAGIGKCSNFEQQIKYFSKMKKLSLPIVLYKSIKIRLFSARRTAVCGFALWHLCGKFQCFLFNEPVKSVPNERNFSSNSNDLVSSQIFSFLERFGFHIAKCYLAHHQALFNNFGICCICDSVSRLQRSNG